MHGTRKTNPIEVAKARKGFITDGRPECFYSRGVYFAHTARYSHHFAYRSKDLEGAVPAEDGPFHHLIIASVLRGAIKRQRDPWSMAERSKPGAGRLALGDGFDSLEGGPHRPSCSGPGKDDSLMCVVYESSQALAEFIVTYTVCRDMSVAAILAPYRYKQYQKNTIIMRISAFALHGALGAYGLCIRTSFGGLMHDAKVIGGGSRWGGGGEEAGTTAAVALAAAVAARCAGSLLAPLSRFPPEARLLGRGSPGFVIPSFLLSLLPSLSN